MNRWSKNGVIDRVFEQLQRERIMRIKLEAVSLDSTIVKVHPDGTGALQKTALTFSLSPGQAHDASEGRKLLNRLGRRSGNPSLVMDRAYEGSETRQLALALGYTP